MAHLISSDRAYRRYTSELNVTSPSLNNQSDSAQSLQYLLKEYLLPGLFTLLTLLCLFVLATETVFPWANQVFDSQSDSDQAPVTISAFSG